MDSDIFATDPFDCDLLADLSGAAVFSAPPAWATHAERILPSDFRLISGIHHETDDGTCLGSSYFAVYDNRVLTAVMQETGVGFQACHWHRICPDIRFELNKFGWRKDGYDTGRVLNLLLQARGHRLCYRPHAALCHIGGFSFIKSSGRRADDSSGAGESQTLMRSVISRLRKTSRVAAAGRSLRGLTRSERQAIISRRLNRRDPIRLFFSDLLTAVHTGSPAPVRPTTGVREVDENVQRAAQELRLLFEHEHGGQSDMAAA